MERRTMRPALTTTLFFALLISFSMEAQADWLGKMAVAKRALRSSVLSATLVAPSTLRVTREQGRAEIDFVKVLQNPGIVDLLEEIDVQSLVLGDGFKGILSTVIESDLVPSQFQPTLRRLGPYIPYIIHGYYECGGQTRPFFDALNSVLSNPLVQPFLEDPSLLEATLGNPELLAATLPAAYSSVVTSNPLLYDWLASLPAQCIVGRGYVQPAAVILAEGTPFDQVASQLPKLVDDYYNTGCTTEQLLAYAPVLLEALGLPPAQQTAALFQKTGTSQAGEEVGFTTPSNNGGPSILQCLTPNLAVLTTVIAVG